jgi:NtrC-family two-component system response regulator AlgB
VLTTDSGSAKKCLVVDDEAAICQTITYALDTDGWTVRSCRDLASSRKAIAEESFDLALLDLRVGRSSGLNLLPALQQQQPGIPIVIITAYASIPSAVNAMRRGATDYLPKPFNPAELRQAVAHAMADRAHHLRERTLHPEAILESRVPAMQILLKKAITVAQSGATTLLLQGETGTGKGVLAKAVHDHSPRRAAPFVVVSCPVLSPDTLESELFGHERGSFTGAYRDHPGRIAQAEGGTLFLDEVGDLPLALQTKLLRVLQEREYERLGGSQTIKADVRVISATNVDLPEAVRQGRFRQDLYYRLSAVELHIPPLRERIEDLPAIIARMLKEVRQDMGRGPKGLSTQALKHLMTYAWPGNLRELRNLVERVCVMEHKDEVQLKDLAALYEAPRAARAAAAPESELGSLAQMESDHIRKVLAQNNTFEQAAKVLGITGVTLWRKRKRYGL